MPSVNKHGKWLFSFCRFNFSPMRTFSTHVGCISCSPPADFAAPFRFSLIQKDENMLQHLGTQKGPKIWQLQQCRKDMILLT